MQETSIVTRNLPVLYESTVFLQAAVVAIKSHYTVSELDSRYYPDHSVWSTKQS